MSSSAQISEPLRSGHDGVYDISFLGASVRHGIDRSRAVFGAMNSPSLATMGETWCSLSEEDRAAYLLEHHEFAHHALMFSTPAGVLNWRMNQVISRDIQWLLLKCTEAGVDFDQLGCPRDLLTTRKWQRELRRQNVLDRATKLEVLRTIAGLEDVLLLRQIMFEGGAPAHFADLTFGELRSLLGRTHAYLSDRCDVPLNRRWLTRLPPTTKVFPKGRAFNLVDIAEVHAISMELFVLRAVGDLEGFRLRAERARAGPYGEAFGAAVGATSGANDLGMSPHQMQMMALLSFATGIDVRQGDEGPAYLEETLPWWRFTAGETLARTYYIDAARNCQTLCNTPLIGEGSRWIQLMDAPFETRGARSLARIAAVAMTITSLGIDRQIHAIHGGASLNWRYLASQLEADGAAEFPQGFERVDYKAWRGDLQRAVLLVEYSDGIYFQEAAFDHLYPPRSPARRMRHLGEYEHPMLQLAGQIISGAIPRINYAAYAGHAVPRLDVLTPKLAAYLGNAEAAGNLIEIIATLIEGRLAVVDGHVTLMPPMKAMHSYI